MQSTQEKIDSLRSCRPEKRSHLWLWVNRFTGVSIPYCAVCADHTAPFDLFARQVLERPSMSLWHGPRGSGKSFLSAIDTHVTSRFNRLHGTRILGGSLAQSEQIYQALSTVIRDGAGKLGGDGMALESLTKQEARYRTGSTVKILAASATSVRGPHVPTLKLDEVDEIDPDIRESAMGMCMELHGSKPSVLMTSTWHRIAGPMADLIETGRAGAFPVDTFCVFEVLERCPPERSGEHLEKCPECPLMQWCHADMGSHPSGVPKAKRSQGHYTIDSLIQKTKGVSRRVFESDYLCLRPKAAGIWFTAFDESIHVRPTAEYRRDLDVHVAIDPGVETGAIWLQVQRQPNGGMSVNVFGEHYDFDSGPEANAAKIMRLTESLCGIGVNRMRVSMDPAGRQRNAGGRIVAAEYERAGLKGRNGLEQWPLGTGYRKGDGLAIMETLLRSASGIVNLTIHPRCQGLITAFGSYRRKSVRGQWLDEPEDPQHPHEEYIDCVAGALKLEAPEGRTPPPKFRSVRAGPGM